MDRVQILVPEHDIYPLSLQGCDWFVVMINFAHTRQHDCASGKTIPRFALAYLTVFVLELSY